MAHSEFIRHDLAHSAPHALEELAEMQVASGDLCKAIAKALRWGWFSYNPLQPEELRELNIDWALRAIEVVRAEMQDAQGALSRLETALMELPRQDGQVGAHRDGRTD